MARGKKVKTGGESRGIPRGIPQTDARSPKSPKTRSNGDSRDNKAFTLRDAARTEHGAAFWNASINLRHQSIGFVRSLDSAPVEPQEVVKNNSEGMTDIPTVPRPTAEDNEHANADLYSTMIDDQARPPDLVAARSPPAAVPSNRSLSPTASNSSDEIVLFRGRKHPRHSLRVSDMPSNFSTFSAREPTSTSEDPPATSAVRHGNDTDSSKLRGEQLPGWKVDLPLGLRSGGEVLSMTEDVWVDEPIQSKRKGKKRRVRPLSSDDDIDSVLDDYVANMLENGTGDEMVDISKMTDEPQTDRDGWASGDIEDFDNMSTSDEVLEVVQQILSKRQRPSGVQYLVVWDGQSVDEARWIAKSSLTMDGAAALIGSFEVAEKDIAEYASGTSEDDDGDSPVDDPDDASNDNDGSDDENDDFEDERDLIERRAARLSDEKLARLLAKQEEHGLGSDELVLFDEMFADDDEEEQGSDEYLQFETKPARRRGTKGTKQKLEFLGGFNEVMMFGGRGEYGDFDVMDRERPSLGRGSKKQSDPLTWGLSDSDQAETLRNAWAADRKTKKLKKQEREELRAQGLLGKKNKFKPDLKMKYNDGLNIDQLGQELEVFLSSSHESRALPPMDKRDRKVVHEIASMFGLKSSSKGSGHTRFPILQKTSKTIEFNEGLFARLRGRTERRYFPRMDRKSTVPVRAPRGRGGGNGVVRADFGYREGEVVGATAPELGADNRGRAMLEKMGWSTGNALGALNNKGILQPITHVVKNSRAGLG